MKNISLTLFLTIFLLHNTIISCSIDQRGTDEEFVVLKLIEAIGNNKGADALLQGLIEQKLEGESLFKTLYEKMHNYGGEDNFTAYIQTLYKYWVVSSYNDFERFSYEEASDVIPYKSVSGLGFYFDDYNFIFQDANRIQVNRTNKQLTEHTVLTSTTNLGVYEVYQPINVVNISQEGEIKLPSKNIPLFYLKAFDDVNSTSNFLTGAELTFDVVTTVSGVGNLAKLRHLRHLTKLQKLKLIIGTVEVTSASASILLKYTDNCGNQAFCEKLSTYLFWIEMASLSVDAITEQMIKKSAREALDIADHTVSKEVKEELAKVVGENLYESLSSILKRTYDDLTSKGLRAIESGNIIKFFDKSGIEVAQISNMELIPKKWIAYYQREVITKTETGHWLIKNGDEYGFDLGYKNGRILTSEQVNTYHKGIGNHSPYKPLHKVFERDLQVGDKVYIVEYKYVPGTKNAIPNPGGWGSKNKITTIKELREDLSVLEGWKDASQNGGLVVREYTVKKPLPVRDGVVGPLQEVGNMATAPIYRGGQQQYEFMEYLGNSNWESYLSISEANKKGVDLIK